MKDRARHGAARPGGHSADRQGGSIEEALGPKNKKRGHSAGRQVGSIEEALGPKQKAKASSTMTLPPIACATHWHACCDSDSGATRTAPVCSAAYTLLSITAKTHRANLSRVHTHGDIPLYRQKRLHKKPRTAASTRAQSIIHK